MVKIILAIFIINVALYAENDYLIKLANPQQIDSKSFEFEITIQNTGNNFELSSYQCAFTFDIVLTEKDSISLQYIENSSELSNKPTIIIGFNDSDSINKLTFVSGIGNDVLDTTTVILGKFRITSNIEFNEETLNLKWNFSGVVNTIITDANFEDITDPANFINFENSITSIDDKDKVSANYFLSQNYPNPYNPTTSIKYSIGKNGNKKFSKVKLVVYDLLGRVVRTLVKKIQAAGEYEIEFNSSGVASGTYFYRLETDNFVETKKMILLK